MLTPPQIVQTETIPTAILHLTVPREEIGEVMGPGLQEVRETIAAQGIAIAGPWFAHHFEMQPGLFNFEICIPVVSPVVAAGRVRPSEWPAMTVMRTVYHGPYEGLGEAWGEFQSWMEGHGHLFAEDLWERYLVGYESESDSALFQTELSLPLLSEPTLRVA